MGLLDVLKRKLRGLGLDDIFDDDGAESEDKLSEKQASGASAPGRQEDAAGRQGQRDSHEHQKENQKENQGLQASQAGTALEGIVLLQEREVDWSVFSSKLTVKWGIQATKHKQGDTLLFEVGQMGVVCALIPEPVPDREAEDCCRYNLLWPNAEKVVSGHQAYIKVTIKNGKDPIEVHTLFTKIMACLLDQRNALGLYMQPMVMEPRSYVRAAEGLHEGRLPVQLWVFVGLYSSAEAVGAYTYGLHRFGKDEIEVLDSSRSMAEVYEMVAHTAAYVVAQDVELRHGETISAADGAQLQLVRSAGVAAQGDSIKIAY